MLANKIIMVLALSVGLVFAGVLGVQAFNSTEGTYAPIFYSGKIVAIDPAYGTMTVQADSRDEAYFNVADKASLIMCGRDVNFGDLKIGDTVELTYATESLGGNRFITDLKAESNC
ncbi:MAG: hypothetical protein C0402_13775 [Thermodesulfovibrio sp.]|nr:hypothetical protein [Thermodesulfovibrio sp.]